MKITTTGSTNNIKYNNKVLQQTVNYNLNKKWIVRIVNHARENSNGGLERGAKKRRRQFCMLIAVKMIGWQ